MNNLHEIKMSYGIHWGIVKNIVDDFGWIQIAKHDDSFDDLMEDIEMFDYFDYELETCFSRPKSLEFWENIKNYEGVYQVSDLGEFRSLDRTIKKRGNSLGFLKGKVFNKRISNKGYNELILTTNSVKKNMRVNRLVYMSFVGELIDGLVIDHRDNIKTNDYAINLQQITPRENSSKDQKNRSSKYVGVGWYKKLSKWQSRIRIKGKLKHLGYFDNEIEASNAYKTAQKQLS